MARNGIDISYLKVVRGSKTTRFKLVYKDSERELTLMAKAEGITRFDVELIELKGKTAIVGPVIGEVALDALESVKSRAGLTALDVQGYLREAEIKGPVKLVRSETALKAVSMADIVHADAEEANVLTGLPPHASAKWMVEQGAKVALVTMGDGGAYVAWGENVIYVPAAEPSQVADATGAGDVFLTVFTVEYSRGSSVQEAAAMAAAAAAFKVERQGFEGLRDRWRVRSRARSLLEKMEKVEASEES